MSTNKYDLEFLKHFAQLIAGLMVLTVVLAMIAYHIYSGVQHPVGENRKAELASRIAPEGAVYAGATGQAAKAAAEEAARKAAAAQVAYEGTMDGAVIFDKLCGACHMTGVGGAPKMEKGQWADRSKQGVETLVKHAIEGYTGAAGVMPARGGNPSLTNEQVESTVKWMLANMK